jgi:hypothetical protein
MMWCTKRTNIYLAEGQAAALARAASTAGPIPASASAAT